MRETKRVRSLGIVGRPVLCSICGKAGGTLVKVGTGVYKHRKDGCRPSKLGGGI